MSVVVEVQDLVKTYRPQLFGRPVAALSGLSFSVDSGTCFGLLGRNGAGKTTALKVLTGLVRANSGSAQLLGRPCGDPRTRREIGYLPENPYFHEHLTPREGLRLFGRLTDRSSEDVARATHSLLERVGLGSDADRHVREFSKGMRQRYGLAAALLADPALLLLDEPFSGLDPAGRRMLKEIILEEKAAGRSVLLSSHVLADIEELCDRVAVIEDGKVRESGALTELLSGQPTAVDLCVRDISSELREALRREAVSSRVSGDDLHLTYSGADLGPQQAARVYREGGQVLSLVPQRESLEQWFVRRTAVVEPMNEEEVEACV